MMFQVVLIDLLHQGFDKQSLRKRLIPKLQHARLIHCSITGAWTTRKLTICPFHDRALQQTSTLRILCVWLALNVRSARKNLKSLRWLCKCLAISSTYSTQSASKCGWRSKMPAHCANKPFLSAKIDYRTKTMMAIGRRRIDELGTLAFEITWAVPSQTAIKDFL